MILDYPNGLSGVATILIRKTRESDPEEKAL